MAKNDGKPKRLPKEALGRLNMKKLICTLLAMVMMCGAAAIAEPVPSKSASDLTKYEIVINDRAVDDGSYFRNVAEDEAEFEELLTIWKEESEKLNSFEDPEEYFGEVVNGDCDDADDEPLIDIKKELECTEVNVFEFWPVTAGGFAEDVAEVDMTMLFATPYEPDEDVLVLIGLVETAEDGTAAVRWTAFEGEGLEADDAAPEMMGGIETEISGDMIRAIENEMALLAIVSK